MSEWREVEINEIVASANTGLDAIKRAPIVENNTGIKCMRIQDVSQNKAYENWGFTNVEEKNYKKFQLKRNDIIIARTGATVGVNSFIYSDLKSVFNNGLIRIRTNSNACISKFLYYHFQTGNFRGFIESISGGTSSQPNMQINVLLSYDISLPPLLEQKAIAEVLSSLDDKIDLLHRQNKTLEQMAQTLFRQWFVEEAGEDWGEVLITDLFEIRDGTHDSPKQKPFGKPLITSKHIKNHNLDFDSAYLISEEDVIKVNQRSVVNQFDILFSMIGTIGLVYIESNSNIDYAIKNVGLFKTSQNITWVYFTYLWLRSSLGREFIFESKSGSTQQYISLGSLRNIKFTLPKNAKIDLFNSEVKTLFDKIFYNQTQIHTLQSLRDTLLPKLMSGEVRVEYDKET